MLGIAVALLVSPSYIGAVFVGAAIGSAIRIRQRRRAGAAAGKRQPQRRRRSGGKR